MSAWARVEIPVWLAQQGWDTTGYDPAEKAVALARETADKLNVKINTVIAKDRDFDMGVAKWDLILLSYVEIRGNAEKVMRALAPGGIVVAEYFHEDNKSGPSGFADNELLKIFGKLRVLRYEDTCVWQLILAHFGSLLWPTLEVTVFRLGRKAGPCLLLPYI